MNLSVAMIGEALSDFVQKEDLRGYDERLSVARFQFFEPDMPLKADTLYVFTPEMLNSQPIGTLSPEEGTAFLLMGSPEEHAVPENTAAIYITERLALPRLTNHLCRVFERYASVDEALRACIRSHATLQTLTELATPLFGNELTIRDRNYRYIAHSYKTVRFNSRFPTDSEGNTSPDELSALKRNPLYVEQNPDETPWYYNNFGQNMWCQDLFISNQFLYRIKLADINHPFRAYDRELLGYFVQLVRAHCLSNPEVRSHDLREKVFSSLLEKEQFSMRLDLETCLGEMEWDAEDLFLAACIRSGDNAGIVTAYNYYGNYLNNAFPYAVTVQYDGSLVMIADLTRGGLTADQFKNALTVFLRDKNFRGGLSFPFHSLLKAAFFFRQAKIALTTGLAYSPQVWVYRFRDFRFHYLLEKVTEDFSYREYLVPGLARLLEHDAEKSSDFYTTLREYLFCDRNITQAAQKLHVHRSTMMYRLEKIREILGEDPDQEETRALLAFLLAMDKVDTHFSQD